MLVSCANSHAFMCASNWYWSQEMAHLLLQQRWQADSLSSRGEQPQHSGCLSLWCDAPLSHHLFLQCPHVTGCRSESTKAHCQKKELPNFQNAAGKQLRCQICKYQFSNTFLCDYSILRRTFIPTTPFCTLKPSWYLVSGRLILTSTTGAHGTTVNFTTVWVLVFCNSLIWSLSPDIHYST